MATLLDRSRSHERWSLTAVDASGTNNSESIDGSAFQQVSVQVNHTSHSDTSTWELRVSNDGGTSWDTVTGSSKTTSGASGSDAVDIDPFQYQFLRITVTEADANASARLTPYIVLKRKS